MSAAMMSSFIVPSVYADEVKAEPLNNTPIAEPVQNETAKTMQEVLGQYSKNDAIVMSFRDHEKDPTEDFTTCAFWWLRNREKCTTLLMKPIR